MLAHEVIKRPLVTEKAVEMSEGADVKERVYFFEVDRRANKGDIRKAIEELYGVKVSGVRTMWRHGKTKRWRSKRIHRADWKRAAVTLVEGDLIDLI
ncbi:MAG: 50S ribosomal protein L23 [Planctomycetes bacterium]|nr:50S ribosomal protein L23 [Planctomycetota bacterium]